MADTDDTETARPTRRALLVLMAGLAAVTAGCAADDPSRGNALLRQRERRRRMGLEGQG